MSRGNLEVEHVENENSILKYHHDLQSDISQSSENLIIVDSTSETNLYKQNDYIKMKPEHWTDSYWQTITSEYSWFIHKDGNAGCRICWSNKTFMGKKSLIATWKLKLMDLSYEAFEKRLLDHNLSTQHKKSVMWFNDFYGNSDDISAMIVNNDADVTQSAPVANVRRVYTFDFICPICSKGYKFKRGLARHVFNCNKDPDSRGFLSPCGCEGYLLYAISDIDEHNTTVHQGKYLFNCKICVAQHKSATVLYEHLLLNHNYEWNPYVDMPMITVNTEQQYSSKYIERKKRISNSDEAESGSSDNHGIKPSKRKKSSNNDSVPDNKIEKIITPDKQEMSHLRLSLDQIHTCEYCGGRYLSANILNEHMATRHAIVQETLEMEDEDLKRKHRTTSDDALTSESVDSKKMNHISACLLACPMCQALFDNLDDRNDHVIKHHPEIEQFICQHCGLIFTNHINYNRHVEKSHNCDASLKMHKNRSLITFSCSDCPLVFTNQADLSHHVNLSHRDSLVTTSNENEEHVFGDKELAEIKETDSDGYVAELISADSDECVCSCTVCDVVAHNRYELKVHALSHPDCGKEAVDLPSCPNCSRLFFGQFGKLYLKDHYNIEHLRKPAPQCILCKALFVSSYVLDKHLSAGTCLSSGNDDPYQPLMSHDKQAFACAQCGAIFAGDSAKYRLEVHNRTCTLELMDDDEFLDS